MHAVGRYLALGAGWLSTPACCVVVDVWAIHHRRTGGYRRPDGGGGGVGGGGGRPRSAPIVPLVSRKLLYFLEVVLYFRQSGFYRRWKARVGLLARTKIGLVPCVRKRSYIRDSSPAMRRWSNGAVGGNPAALALLLARVFGPCVFLVDMLCWCLGGGT